MNADYDEKDMDTFKTKKLVIRVLGAVDDCNACQQAQCQGQILPRREPFCPKADSKEVKEQAKPDKT